jgi:hypothetical protein
MVLLLSIQNVIETRQAPPSFQEALIGIVGLLTYCLDEETKNIIRWLSPVNFWLKQEDVCKQRAAGTGKWLLEHPDFLDWEKGNKEMFWCCGSRELCLYQ